jgi:hypothetical protein
MERDLSWLPAWKAGLPNMVGLKAAPLMRLMCFWMPRQSELAEAMATLKPWSCRCSRLAVNERPSGAWRSASASTDASHILQSTASCRD